MMIRRRQQQQHHHQQQYQRERTQHNDVLDINIIQDKDHDDRPKWKWCRLSWWIGMMKRRKRSVVASIYVVLVAVILIIPPTIHFLVLHEYGWMYRRCVLSYVVFPWNMLARVQCIEAYYHKLSSEEPTLWNSTQLQESPNHQSQHQRSHPVQHVHYTITSPLSKEPWELALCSIRLAYHQLCTPSSTEDDNNQNNLHACTVNVWIVDQAAEATTTTVTNNTAATTVPIDIVQELIQHVFHQPSKQQQQHRDGDGQDIQPPWCIRVAKTTQTTTTSMSDALAFEEYGSGCVPVAAAAAAEPATTTTNDSNDNNNINKVRLLQRWLRYDCKNQLPAHISDGWRLVALAELGGLYLDADVLISVQEDDDDDDRDGRRKNSTKFRLLHLPSPVSVPAQDTKSKAYRLNGGLLRMEPSSLYLSKLIDDFIYWSTQLETLSLEEQTFGFLGPASLTRVYIDMMMKVQQQNKRPLLRSSVMTTEKYSGLSMKERNDDDDYEFEIPYIIPLDMFQGKQTGRRRQQKQQQQQGRGKNDKHIDDDCRIAFGIHLTGHDAKEQWKARIKGSCVESSVQQYCPDLL